MGAGSLRGSVLTLMSAAIGPGSLLLPFVFRLVGIPLGLACLAFGTYCGAQSLRLIMTIAHITGCDSYPRGVACLLGPLAGALLSAVMCFCVLLATGSHLKFLTGLLQLALPEGTTAAGARLAAVLVAFPACAVRDLGALRHVAALAPVCLGYIGLLVVARGLQSPGLGAAAPAADVGGLLSSGVGGLSELPRAWSIVVSALTCHHVAVPVFRQLHHARARRVNKVVLRSSSCVAFMYAPIGIMGFVSQGADTPENILLAYSSADPAVMLGQAMVGVILLITIPMCVGTLRCQVRHVFPRAFVDSLFGHLALTGLLLLLSTGVCAVFPSVSSIIGVMSGFGLMLYMFAVPALCVCAIRWRLDGAGQKTASWSSFQAAMHMSGGSGSLQDLLLSSPLSMPLLGRGHSEGMISPRASCASSPVPRVDSGSTDLPELVMEEAIAQPGGRLQSRPARSRSPASTTRASSRQSSARSGGSNSPAQWQVGAQWSCEFALSLASLAFASALGMLAGAQSAMQLM